MYFSATTLASAAHHCVGAATSRTVLGPYTPLSAEIACPLALGGAIDASGFKNWANKGGSWGGNDGWGWTAGQPHDSWNDSAWSCGGEGGARYVVYKIDGNSIGHGGVCGNSVAPIVSTAIMLQEVEADGVTLVGQPVKLLDNEGLSDDGVVEAPSMVKTAAGEYVLFFSSGCYSTVDYTVSYATATSVTGPYTRQSPALFYTGKDGLLAPGGASIFWDAQHMVFHAGEFSSLPMMSSS